MGNQPENQRDNIKDNDHPQHQQTNAANDNQLNPGSNTVKDPDDWTTGDEPMTGAQRSYLNTLASEAGEQINDQLSKAEASKKINELQQKTGRGLDR